jgi:hypothetical protein
MAVLVVCGVNEQGYREVLAVEPMMRSLKRVTPSCFKACRIAD